jgi:rubrerythrin
MSTQTETRIDNEQRTEEEQEEGRPIHSHIVDRGDDPRTVQAIIFEARVEGTPVTALCGYTWVPSRNPENYPLCSQCAEIFEFAKDFRS